MAIWATATTYAPRCANWGRCARTWRSARPNAGGGERSDSKRPARTSTASSPTSPECTPPPASYQWGSLLDGEHFDERSDIDIALEGVTDAAAFFALLADAENLTTFSLDIVQLETIHQEFAKSIRARGRVVYER